MQKLYVNNNNFNCNHVILLSLQRVKIETEYNHCYVNQSSSYTAVPTPAIYSYAEVTYYRIKSYDIYSR